MKALLIQGKEAQWEVELESGAASFQAPDMTLRYDVASSTVSYIGKAKLGTPTSSAGWKIKRLTTDAAGGVVVEYADGDAEFDNVWDNRANLVYS